MEDLFSNFEEMTIKEIEKRESLTGDDLHDSEISPWFLKKREEFKYSIQDGDEIYYFRTSSITWKNLCGREGYAIYRNGKEIDSIIFNMN